MSQPIPCLDHDKATSDSDGVTSGDAKMNWRMILWSGIGAAVLLAAGGALWIFSLPPGAAALAAAPIAEEETDATIRSLMPPKRARPLIAIIGINDATETTDYLMPYGILKRADVADVVALATGSGPVTLYPALTVEPDMTVADFDANHPQGADYVIVPAMTRDDDATVLGWIKSQSAKGAIVIGVCAGAEIVGEAGLLDGKRATAHWYSLRKLIREHPTMRYVADRRFVTDKGVATTTGITASMPMTLTLIQAIAGRDKAQDVARDLGLENWDARHASAAFKLTRPFALTAIGNSLAFWKREQLGLALAPRIDEVSLALVADAWSRTYRSRALTVAKTSAAQVTLSGLRVLPDHAGTDWPPERLLPVIAGGKPAQQLDQVLAAIAARYGEETADFVAIQLEYQRPGKAN